MMSMCISHCLKILRLNTFNSDDWSGEKRDRDEKSLWGWTWCAVWKEHGKIKGKAKLPGNHLVLIAPVILNKENNKISQLHSPSAKHHSQHDPNRGQKLCFCFLLSKKWAGNTKTHGRANQFMFTAILWSKQSWGVMICLRPPCMPYAPQRLKNSCHLGFKPTIYPLNLNRQLQQKGVRRVQSIWET